MESRIKELLEIARAATPGPWEAVFVFGSSDLPCSVQHNTGEKQITAGVDVPVVRTIVNVDDECDRPTPNFRHIATFNPALVEQLLLSLGDAVAALDFYRQNEFYKMKTCVTAIETGLNSGDPEKDFKNVTVNTSPIILDGGLKAFDALEIIKRRME